MAVDDIILSNSDIEEIIEDVDITETVYKEEGKIRLNSLQIEAEIGNLFPGNMPLFRLKNKTHLYSSMFTSTQQFIPRIQSVIPIVHVLKKKVQNPRKSEKAKIAPNEYFINLEDDPLYFIKGAKLVDLLKNYQVQNTQKEGSYQKTSSELYELQKPFIDKGSTPISYETDALWHYEDELFRLVPKQEVDVGHRPDLIDAEYLKEYNCPQGKKYLERPEFETLYEGDKPNVIGYASYPLNKQPFETFSLKAYKSHIQSLQPGTKVEIYFNLYAYDYRNHRISDLEGKVIDNDGQQLVIELEKNVQMEKSMLKELICPLNKYVPFFVYEKDFTPKYHKGQLLTKNYKFDFTNTKYIQPQSWAEWSFITQSKVPFPYHELDLYPHLKNNFPIIPKAPFDNPYKFFHIYQSTSTFFDFNKHKQDLQYYEKYESNHDTDLNRLIFLLNQDDKGLLYCLSQRRNIEIQQETINQLKQKANQISLSKQTHQVGKIAKYYATIEEMNADNGKSALYFDAKYDTTKYHLKNTANKQGHELRQYLLNLLDGDEFEVECIINGNRPLTDGDMAYVGPKNKVYRWANIQNKFMWIKSAGIPVCEASLPNYADIAENSTTMVIDSFDNLCKKVEDARKHHRYMQLKNQIEMLEDILEPVNSDQFKATLVRLLDLCKNTKHMKKQPMMQGYIDKTNYDEYYGDESLYTLDNMFMNFDFEAGPTIMNFEKKTHDDKQKKTILEMLCKVLDIQLYLKDIKDINTFLDTEYPQENVTKAITTETQSLTRNKESAIKLLDKKAATERERIKNNINQAYKKELESIYNKNWKNYYFDVIFSCAAYLCIVIMVRYPDVYLHKMMPGCIKYFNYKGYPMIKNEEEVQRSLTKYIACVLKALYQPNDLKFQHFNEMDYNVKNINVRIDYILAKRYDLKTLLSEKKIENTEVENTTTYDVLNVFFKPNFEFTKAHYQNKLIEYMRFINTKISQSQINKLTALNLPFLSNSCCLELIERTTNYYNIFSKHPEFETLAKHLEDKPKPKSVPLFPKSIPDNTQIITMKKLTSLKQSPVEFEEKPIEFEPAKPSSWWDEVLYPSNLRLYEYITDKLTSNPKLKRVNELVVKIDDVNDLVNLRNIYANCLRGSFTTIIGKLVSLYKLKKDEKPDINSPFLLLLASLEDSPAEMHAILNKISHELSSLVSTIQFDSRSQDVIKTSQNIMYYTHSLMVFFMKCIFLTTSIPFPEGENSEDTLIMQLENALITATPEQTVFKTNILKMIQIALEEIHDYFEANYFDISSLKKSVEIIREKKKEEMMAKYSKDDEKRNLQKILKNMGINDILDIDIDDLPEKEPELVVAIEPEYTNYVDAAGENADDDVDYDGYD